MLIGIDASRAGAAHVTGTEAYSLHLIRALVELETGHKFRLYVNDAPDAGLFPESPNIEIRYIPFPRLWTHLRLAVELYRDRVDALFVPSHVLPAVFPGPAVVTVHDLGYLHFPQAHPGLDRLYLNLSTRWNARRASVVVADSQVTRQDLIRHYRTRPQKIEVVYPGFDTSLRPVTDPALVDGIRRRYNIDGDYFLYLGTLQPRKNLERLVDAASALNASGRRPAQLVLAGKQGWLSDPILAHARKQNVILPGYIPENDKAALLSGAAAFVFPSLYEGFGFPVLEAMACGTPVICSSTSSLPEVAGDAALLVDPLDTAGLTGAMQRLLNDDSLRQDLIRRGFANVGRFSWEQCARQVMSAIEGAA